MDIQNREASQALPLQITDAAWNSMLPFLSALSNVYVSNPETCRRFLPALLWNNKGGGNLAGPPESLWLLEHDL